LKSALFFYVSPIRLSANRIFAAIEISRHSKSNVRKSNSIELNWTQSMDWVRQSNQIEHRILCEFDFRTNPTKSNKSSPIELNPLDCVGLSSETELNRTQLNGLLSIGSGKPIQSKPKARPSKQVFLVLFYNLFNNRNPIYKLSTAVKRTEQNRTEQNKAIIIPVGVFRNCCTLSFFG